jgi:hypothetical protein
LEHYFFREWKPESKSTIQIAPDGEAVFHLEPNRQGLSFLILICMEFDISEWCRRIVSGDTGFSVMEDREFMVFKNSTERDVALVEFVVRALANLDCEGSKDVLAAIARRRVPKRPFNEKGAEIRWFVCQHCGSSFFKRHAGKHEYKFCNMKCMGESRKHKTNHE